MKQKGFIFAESAVSVIAINVLSIGVYLGGFQPPRATPSEIREIKQMAAQSVNGSMFLKGWIEARGGVFSSDLAAIRGGLRSLSMPAK